MDGSHLLHGFGRTAPAVDAYRRWPNRGSSHNGSDIRFAESHPAIPQPLRYTRPALRSIRSYGQGFEVETILSSTVDFDLTALIRTGYLIGAILMTD